MEEPVNNDNKGDEPLGLLDLEDQWEVQAPPAGFAERVLDRLRAEDPVRIPSVATKRRGWRAAATAGVAALAIAAAIILKLGGPPSHGEAIARDRTEVALGSRALAVLEPDARVTWDGDDVVQSRGDVFYRVEPGARFTVHTPAGDVEVKGTCFAVKVRSAGSAGPTSEDDVMQKRDVKVGVVSAALTALAFVAVYEGKVAVSHASSRVDLKAGESAQTGPDGVKRMSGGEQEFDKNVQAAGEGSSSDDPTNKANASLVRQVGEYRSRLEALAKQKGELEEKLKRSEATLAASQDGSTATPKHDYDLSQDDWKELAKEDLVKFQTPCINTKEEPWSPNAEQLNALGLAPADAATIKGAYGRSSQRVWSQLKPLCAAAIGSEAVAEKIGPDTCLHLILDVDSERDPEATKNARREVAEMRAGLRPMPGPKDNPSASVKAFLIATGASKAFEDDLAQSFGPEEAHRIVYSGEICMGTSTFGGRRKPKKR